MSAKKSHAPLSTDFLLDDDDSGTAWLQTWTLAMGAQQAFHDSPLFKAAAGGKPSGGGQTADPAYLGVDSAALWTPALTVTGNDTPSNITALYSFPNAASDYGKGYTEANKFVAFNSPGHTSEIAAFLSVPNQVNNFLSGLNLVQSAPSADSTADIRIGKTVTTGADAWAYYPALNKGGDVWFNRNDAGAVYGGKGGMNWDPTHLNPGDYTYTVFLHEFGHALGLKHSFESGGVAGAVSHAYDSLEYTLMSYDAFQATPYDQTVDQRNWWADDGNNPQTYMTLDIAALQYMYGADYKTNSGNTTYAWNKDTGNLTITETVVSGDNVTPSWDSLGTNKIFMTIWDGGGNDTYDFSNYTDPSVGISIDLQPGHWVTINDLTLYSTNPTLDHSQRADLLAGTGERFATGNIDNALIDPRDSTETKSLIENAIGGSGKDTFIGNVQSNSFTGNDGADTFVFNSLTGGIDTLVDFLSGTDKLSFDHTIFTALGATTGPLPFDDFWAGAAAHDGNDYIVYDQSLGKLYYDPDGFNAAAAPVQIALLGTATHPDLIYSDILIA